MAHNLKMVGLGLFLAIGLVFLVMALHGDIPPMIILDLR